MKNLYGVIMAGGVGSRFWPMSTTQLPKQFHDILGTGKTLLQETFDRLAESIPRENILVVTHKSYRSLVTEQLPDIAPNRIVLEPARRNTAPCIAYASLKLFAENPDSIVLVAPSDHLILKNDEFKKTVYTAAKHAAEHKHLLTLGIKPHGPETGFGYIQYIDGSDPTMDPVKKVKTFTEKPDLELAKQFLDSGDFLWNAGIFIWKSSSILAAFEKHQPDLYQTLSENTEVYNTENEAAFIEKAYPTCDNISVDFGILEKAKNVYVIPASFGWSDLGTWGSVYAESKKDESGNAARGKKLTLHQCMNNIVQIDKEKIAVVSGLENFIVIAEGNRLLICPKDQEQDIKYFVNELKMKFGEDAI